MDPDICGVAQGRVTHSNSKADAHSKESKNALSGRRKRIPDHVTSRYLKPE